MSADQIIETLTDLYEIHARLLQLVKEKTESLKNGDIQTLDKLLMQEEKELTLVETAEESRREAVNRFLAKKGVADHNVTMADIQKFVTKAEREQMQQLQEKLLQMMSALVQQNELNRQLTEQSLQFVNMSLSMLAPEPTLLTYERPDQKRGDSGSQSRSIFDSKA